MLYNVVLVSAGLAYSCILRAQYNAWPEAGTQLILAKLDATTCLAVFV